MSGRDPRPAAIKALVHITGGGFPDNIPRVLPDRVSVELDLARVPVLPAFGWLARAGNIAQAEMLRTFNCGVGMIIIVDAGRAAAAADIFARAMASAVSNAAWLWRGAPDAPAVRLPASSTSVHNMVRKRVAILISGRGSNMAALIDAAANCHIPPRS